MTSWRETLAVWFPLAVIGGTFASVQFLWSNFVGFELVDIVAAVASMVAGVIVIRLWHPRRDLAFRAGRSSPPTVLRQPDDRPDGSSSDRTHRPRIARAWMPFALLTVTVLVWGIPAIKPWGTPAVKDWLDARLSWKPELPWLHLKVAKGTAVTGHETPEPKDFEKAQIEIVPLSSTGTAVFLAAVVSGYLLGLPDHDDGAPARRDASAGWSPPSPRFSACWRWAS